MTCRRIVAAPYVACLGWLRIGASGFLRHYNTGNRSCTMPALAHYADLLCASQRREIGQTAAKFAIKKRESSPQTLPRSLICGAWHCSM